MINRANVYVGFQVQLDLTGIFICVILSLPQAAYSTIISWAR